MKIEIDEQGRVIATSKEVERVRDTWALPIGRFIVAFTGCEYWTFQFAKSYCSSEEFSEFANKKLRQRLSFLKKALSIKLVSPETIRHLGQTIERLRSLVMTRNILAHNAPMLKVFVSAHTGEMEVRHELRSSRDISKRLTVGQIRAEAEEAEKVEEELALLYGMIQKDFRAQPNRFKRR